LAQEETPQYEIHVNPIIDASRANLSVSLFDPKTDRTYEIQFLPTVSLRVWLSNNEEIEKNGSNTHIYGVLQINRKADFEKLWTALAEMMKTQPQTNIPYTELFEKIDYSKLVYVSDKKLDSSVQKQAEEEKKQ
jgi:hypothetical protein